LGSLTASPALASSPKRKEEIMDTVSNLPLEPCPSCRSIEVIEVDPIEKILEKAWFAAPRLL
jgi:hypothetical protein